MPELRHIHQHCTFNQKKHNLGDEKSQHEAQPSDVEEIILSSSSGCCCSLHQPSTEPGSIPAASPVRDLGRKGHTKREREAGGGGAGGTGPCGNAVVYFARNHGGFFLLFLHSRAGKQSGCLPVRRVSLFPALRKCTSLLKAWNLLFNHSP